jgi:hypothetical protein
MSSKKYTVYGSSPVNELARVAMTGGLIPGAVDLRDVSRWHTVDTRQGCRRGLAMQ